MRFAIFLTAFLVCGALLAQTSAGYSFESVPNVEGLNPAQQTAVEDYIRRYERPSGEFRVRARRNQISLLSSEALQTLFPRYKFVVITWIYEADPAAMGKYSVPGPIMQTLIFDGNGTNRTPERKANQTEFADFLRAERIKVTDATSAARVRSALAAIYNGVSEDDLRTTDLRHNDAAWFLGYHELPFRPVSSYEEVREARYYRIDVDTDGFVVGGRSMNEVLERRKIKVDGPSH